MALPRAVQLVSSLWVVGEFLDHIWGVQGHSIRPDHKTFEEAHRELARIADDRGESYKWISDDAGAELFKSDEASKGSVPTAAAFAAADPVEAVAKKGELLIS